MHEKESGIGIVGWAITAVTVTAFDLLAEQTMSEWYRDRVHDPRTRAVALGLLALSAYHLTRPDKYPYQNIDPITQMGGFIRDHI